MQAFKGYKMKKLTKEYVSNTYEEVCAAACKEERIHDRITYILKKVCQEFGDELSTWYFYEAGEGELGNLWKYFNDETTISGIVIDIETKPLARESELDGDYVIIDKYGDEFCIGDEIPTRWLYEDFEKELSGGKVKYIQNQADKKRADAEKSLKKKKEQQELIVSAKKKLTKSELAAIQGSSKK